LHLDCAIAVCNQFSDKHRHPLKVSVNVLIFKVEIFGGPFVKRFAICYRSVVCPFVCNVGALWPNGWMDQDETSHAGIGLGTGHIV